MIEKSRIFKTGLGAVLEFICFEGRMPDIQFYRCFFIILICLFCLIPLPNNAVYAAEQITLTWDPPIPEDHVSGYIVYWGQEGGKYDHGFDNGNHTSCVLTGFEKGITYYFAVTAYNDYGAESGFSNEVSTTFNLDDQLPGDFNNDGKVDMLDYTIFLDEWGRDDCNELSVVCLCDLNEDGLVDSLDFNIFRENLSKSIQ